MEVSAMNDEVKVNVPFESSALNGLRGIAALHIMVFHSLFYCTWNFNMYGQVI